MIVMGIHCYECCTCDQQAGTKLLCLLMPVLSEILELAVCCAFVYLSSLG